MKAVLPKDTLLQSTVIHVATCPPQTHVSNLSSSHTQDRQCHLLGKLRSCYSSKQDKQVLIFNFSNFYPEAFQCYLPKQNKIKNRSLYPMVKVFWKYFISHPIFANLHHFTLLCFLQIAILLGQSVLKACSGYFITWYLLYFLHCDPNLKLQIGSLCKNWLQYQHQMINQRKFLVWRVFETYVVWVLAW